MLIFTAQWITVNVHLTFSFLLDSWASFRFSRSMHASVSIMVSDCKRVCAAIRSLVLWLAAAFSRQSFASDMSCSASFCFFIISVCSLKSDGQAVHAPTCTTELENRLQLVSTTVNIIVQQCSSWSDRLTMFDNPWAAAAGNDSHPRVVP